MTARENLEAAKQLTRCFGANRAHRSPFVLHFCNMDYGSLLWRDLHREIPTLTTKSLPVQIHEQEAFELFPKEKLIYLTPDSQNVMKEYNPEDHYIISSLVDRGNKIPLTLAKAKKFDIRTARLPLELYRTVRTNRVLTLDQVLKVMLEVKFNGDWNEAFRYLPSRKFS